MIALLLAFAHAADIVPPWGVFYPASSFSKDTHETVRASLGRLCHGIQCVPAFELVIHAKESGRIEEITSSNGVIMVVFGTTRPIGHQAVLTQGLLESFTGATDGCVSKDQRKAFEHGVAMGWLSPLREKVRIVVRVDGETFTFGPVDLNPNDGMCPTHDSPTPL